MIIGFDADDTLWHNEDGFQASHREFETLLSDYGDPTAVEERLFEIESRNMPKYGYGVKAYTLSLIECAIEISDGHVSTAQIASILDLGHALLDRPVELIDGVTDVLDELGDHTKIDHHQRRPLPPALAHRVERLANLLLADRSRGPQGCLLYTSDAADD